MNTFLILEKVEPLSDVIGYIAEKTSQQNVTEAFGSIWMLVVKQDERSWIQERTVKQKEKWQLKLGNVLTTHSQKTLTLFIREHWDVAENYLCKEIDGRYRLD